VQIGRIVLMKFLYWNLNRKEIPHLVISLAYEHNPDLIILSECCFSLAQLLSEMNTPLKQKYGLPFSPVKDPIFITRFPRKSLVIKSDTLGISVRQLYPPLGPDILIIAMHLASKMYQTDDDQTLSATRIARMIEEEEKKVEHRRTLIVGDLNMNPFDAGVIGAEGLHSIMDPNIVRRRSRKVSGTKRYFFYNPMWTRLGNHQSGPYGTYFYDRSRQINYYWHMFDQVMIRPDLIDFFKDDSLQIVTHADSTSLLDQYGRPDSNVSSDHLPIIFELELIKEIYDEY